MNSIKKSYRHVVLRIIHENRIFLFTLFFGIFICLICPMFATQNNFVNLAMSVAVPGIVACGVLMLIVTGHFDLSVGAIVALAGVVSAKLDISGFSLPIVFFIVLVLGASIGGANAIVVTCFKVNSLVATLAMMFILRGIILLYTNEQTIWGMSKFFLWLGQGSIRPLPVLFVYFLLIAVLSYVILQKTVFGRHLYIIGADHRSAFLSGVRVKFSVALTYIYIGIISAFAGIVYAARYSAASPTAARGMELTVIAAIIIGGANIFGGTGTVVRTFLGVILIEMIFNGLNLLNVDPNYALIIQGLIIVFAVAYDVTSKTLRHE